MDLSRFELLTLCLSGIHSNLWVISPEKDKVGFEPTMLISISVFKTDTLNRSITYPFYEVKGIRTLNLRVVSATLYLLSYLFKSRITGFEPVTFSVTGRHSNPWAIPSSINKSIFKIINYGKNGIRTHGIKTLILWFSKPTL